MKTMLAWILVAVLALTTIVGHQAQLRAVEKVKYATAGICERYSELVCKDMKEQAEKTRPETIWMFYLPLTALIVAVLYAAAKSMSAQTDV